MEYSAPKLGLSLQPVITVPCHWGYRQAAKLNKIDQLELSPSKLSAAVNAARTIPGRH